MNYTNKFHRDIDYGGGYYDEDIEIAPRVDINKVRNDKINQLLDIKDGDDKPSGVMDKLKDFLKW